MLKNTTNKVKKALKKESEVSVECKALNPMQEDLTSVSPLWAWCNRFRELFRADPEIEVGLGGTTNAPIITMIVNNEVKALCIEKLIPKTKEFKEGTVTIEVKIKEHFGGDKYLKDVLYNAFKGNPLFDYMYWWDDGSMTSPCCWVTMKPEAVFWPESDLHNIYGDAFDLPSNIAREILEPQTDYMFYDSRNPEREMPDHNAKKFND